jgi:hypothetical protein
MAVSGNGPGVDHGHASRPTSATKTPISSAPSVQHAEQARRWLCLIPTHSPCSFISTKYPAMSPRARTLSYCSIAQVGIRRPSSVYRTISRRSSSRRVRPNSTRSRTSGNICAATGFPTACATPTTPSLTLHARLGESSSPSRGQSPQSECVIGPTSVNPNNHWYHKC